MLPGEMVDTSSESEEGSNGYYKILSGLGIMVIIGTGAHKFDACNALAYWRLLQLDDNSGQLTSY